MHMQRWHMGSKSQIWSQNHSQIFSGGEVENEMALWIDLLCKLYKHNQKKVKKKKKS